MTKPKESQKDQESDLKIEKVGRIQGFQRKNRKAYFFLPAWVNIEVKEFSSLSVSDQSVKFRATLTIKVLKLSEEYREIEECIKKGLNISLFENRWKLTINENNGKKKDDKNGDISWIYEIDQEIFWKPELFWLPFDRQSLPIRVRIEYLKVKDDDPVRYYFNILNKDFKTVKPSGCLNFPIRVYKTITEYKSYLPTETTVKKLQDFNLYYYQTQSEFRKEWIGKQTVEYCPQITLAFNLTRKPLKLILKVWVPNFILQIITIILFFTDNDFEARIGGIIGIMLAIVAFLPSVHEESPHLRGITLMDLLILPGPINSGLLLFETALKRHTPSYESKGWWIAACTLVGIGFLITALCSIGRLIEYVCIQRKKESIRKMRENKSKGKNENKEGRRKVKSGKDAILSSKAKVVRDTLIKAQDMSFRARGTEESGGRDIELQSRITIPEYDDKDIEEDPSLTYLDKCYIKRQRRRNEETNITLIQ